MNRLKKGFVIALSAITVLSLVACGKSDSDNKEEESTTSSHKTNFMGIMYRGTGYDLTVSDNWEKVDDKTTDLMFTDINSPNEDFKQTINVVVEDCSAFDEIQTCDDYLQAALEQYKTKSNFKVLDTGKNTFNGYDATVAHLEITSNNITYKCEQAFIVKDQIAYILTFSGDENGGYDKTIKEAEGIFNQFAFHED